MILRRYGNRMTEIIHFQTVILSSPPQSDAQNEEFVRWVAQARKHYEQREMHKQVQNLRRMLFAWMIAAWGMLVLAALIRFGVL